MAVIRYFSITIPVGDTTKCARASRIDKNIAPPCLFLLTQTAEVCLGNKLKPKTFQIRSEAPSLAYTLSV